MLGNMMDMNALMATRKYSPAMPWMKMVPRVHTVAPMPKMVSIRLGAMYFIRNVPMNRNERASPIAMMLNICAVDLLMPRLSAYCMMNVHTIICAAT